MFSERTIAKVTAAILILIVSVTICRAVAECPECLEAARRGEYVEGQILVKFTRPISDAVREQLAVGGTVDTLRLSASLDRLTSEYEVTRIQPVFENFYVERQRIERLLQQDLRVLTPSERRMVRRLNRAPEGAIVPDMGRIYRIELEPGQSAPDAAGEYTRDADVEYAEQIQG